MPSSQKRSKEHSPAALEWIVPSACLLSVVLDKTFMRKRERLQHPQGNVLHHLLPQQRLPHHSLF